MAEGNRMPGVDMSKEFSKLNATEQHFLKKIEGLNLKRATEIKALRSRNKLTGLLLLTGVLGVYGYTMFAVQQERFLDDFDEVPGKGKKIS